MSDSPPKPDVGESSVSAYGDLLGIKIDSVADGKAQCSIKLAAQHLNNGGRVHGGVLTSLADSAAGMAVRSIRPAGKLSATTDLTIAFIRPPRGESLRAIAEIVHAGKHLVRTEIAIYSDDRLVAKTSATFMLFNAIPD